ncbi:MAG: P27 family phage terminase small subunit [Acetobacteraceae bacterium]|nr:P27 family phage terminase small subunit [Acetobacteraceae bacterium]
MKHLSERAQCEWKRLAPAAVALGTSRSTDELAFGLLCEVLAREAEARETIEREGYTVPTADGGKSRTRRSGLQKWRQRRPRGCSLNSG